MSSVDARAWTVEIARAAFDLGVGPLVAVALIEPPVLWPLALGIVSGAALVLALPLAWTRLRAPRWLASPWLTAAVIALACLLAARPWLLRTGWPVTVACGALLLGGPLWVRAVRARRGIAVAVWIAATLGLWGSARVFVGLYPSLHLAAVLLGLSLAALTMTSAAPRQPAVRAQVVAIGMAGCLALSLTPWGSRPEVRMHAVHRRSITPQLLRLGWTLADLDDDGAATVWGGADCAAFDRERGPGAWDEPGDGIDQDCTGTDRPLPARAAQSAPAPVPLARSVLIVTGDSLRHDALGAYREQARPISPHLDAWARSAVRFERAYAAAPETRTSLPVILWGSNAPAPRTPSLAARVRAHTGRRAHAVLPAGARFGTAVRRAGFELVEIEETDSLRINPHVLGPLADVARHGGVLWVHYHDPHAPYVRVPGADWGEDSRARYLGLVTRLDRAVHELLQQVPGDMAVIFASDHGEAFGEHGTHYHRSTLYDEQIRVPLLIAAPGIGARVIAQTVGVIDIYATVLELLGLPPTSVVDSRSLVPALRGERLPDAPYRAASWTMVEGLEPPRAWVGVFYGDFKLLRRTDWNVDEIYDLKADPRELRPNAGRAARMRRRLLSLL